jgi:hypothetical protein
MITKKQYSKPQMIEVDDAIKITLGIGWRSREVLFNRRRVLF